MRSTFTTEESWVKYKKLSSHQVFIHLQHTHIAFPNEHAAWYLLWSTKELCMCLHTYEWTPFYQDKNTHTLGGFKWNLSTSIRSCCIFHLLVFSKLSDLYLSGFCMCIHFSYQSIPLASNTKKEKRRWIKSGGGVVQGR